MSIDIDRVVDTLMSELREEHAWRRLDRQYYESRIALLVQVITDAQLLRATVTPVRMCVIWEKALGLIIMTPELSDEDRTRYETTLHECRSVRIKMRSKATPATRDFMLNHSTLSTHGKMLYAEGGMTYETLLYENPRALLYPL